MVEVIEKKEAEVQKEAPKFKGQYKNIKGKKIFNAAGYPLKEVEGHIDPKTEEEKELCAYFASIEILQLVK